MGFTMPASKIERQETSTLKILVYGESGIGKTTFASRFPNTLFLAAETGQGWINGFEPILIPDWQTFKNVLQNISTLWTQGKLCFADKDKTPVQAICIDTIDVLYKMAEKYCCQQLKVNDIADAEWGKGWRTLDNEWNYFLQMIDFISITRLFLAHTMEKADKNKLMRATTALKDKVQNSTHAICDIVMYVSMKRLQDPDNPGKSKLCRVATAQPTTMCYAKDRTGLLPNTFILDYDIFTSYFKEDNSV